MTGLTPAQQYGVTLGQFKRGIEQMFKQIAEGMKLGYSPPEKLSEGELEQLREMKFEKAFYKRVDYERDVGMAFVRNEARRVRRELGLDPYDLA